MSAHILEIKAVLFHGDGPVGYGVDERGREYAVALDVDLATDIAKGLDAGRRPVIAVEKPLYPTKVTPRSATSRIPRPAFRG